MKTASKKAKGRKLQNDVRDCLLQTFPELEQDDIRTAVMGESGEDIKLSPAAQRLIPYSFECKNQERLNIWSSLEQAEDNCNDRKTLSVMVNYNKWKNNIQNNLSRTLSLEEQKYAKSSFYSMVYNLK